MRLKDATDINLCYHTISATHRISRIAATVW